ncbi:hypothetical protein NQ317_004620 [Molorchus minor]|uniref:SWIM-type domain-containing protein n=1 Tax=Molorchus minor TaxID=1323400 RepID=A0ABQ9JJL6_9CUCU|nr:hypothetical protein NQ317_004620 [Molorchus minor]
MSKIDVGFLKGDSDNLPRVDSEMVNEFYVTNMQFLSAEVRNVKTQRSTKVSYGDNAVGYVQLKREGDVCTVKGKLTPEHKIHKKGYNVCAVINEKEQEVISCTCLGCPASEGGCKHGVAFLLWLHRRSEEPSVTSTVDMSLMALLKKDVPPLKPRDPTFVEEVLAMKDCEGVLFKFHKKQKYEDVSIHHLFIKYMKQNSGNPSVEDFLLSAVQTMTDPLCVEAENSTKNQSESKDWFELRFGRITASIVYEAAKCKTLSGALTEKILGAAQPIETKAIMRGKS